MCHQNYCKLSGTFYTGETLILYRTRMRIFVPPGSNLNFSLMTVYLANCCRSCGTFRKATATVAIYSQRAANTTVASCQQGFTGLVPRHGCHVSRRVTCRVSLCHGDSRWVQHTAALLAHLLPMGQKSVAVAVV